MRFNHILSELTIDNVVASIKDYEQHEVREIKKAFDYVNNKQAILDKVVTEGRPNNKVISNYCKEAVDIYAGFLGADTLDIPMVEEFADAVRDAIITGVGYLLVYYDKTLTTKKLHPTNAMVFRDSTITNRVIGGCFWNYYTQLEQGHEQQYVDVYVYDAVNCYYYKGMTLDGIKLMNTFPHHISGVPVIEIKVDAHYDGICAPIYTLQDMTNVILSSYADGRASFSDPFLCISGINVSQDTADNLIDGESKLLNLPLPDAHAEYLIKPDSAMDLTTILEDLDKRIRKAVDLPDLEQFAAASGAALKAKLFLFTRRLKVMRSLADKALDKYQDLIGKFSYTWSDFFEDIDTEEDTIEEVVE